MEAYPADYISHNRPLIALSGLTGPSSPQIERSFDLKQGHGLKVSSDLPPLQEEQAAPLRDEFLKADGTSLPWRSEGLPSRQELMGFKFKFTGRVRLNIMLYRHCDD